MSYKTTQSFHFHNESFVSSIMGVTAMHRHICCVPTTCDLLLKWRAPLPDEETGQMILSESQVLVKKRRSNSRCLVLQSMFSVQKLQIVLNLKININALKFGDVSPSLLKYQNELHARCNILGGIFAGLWKQNVAWFARSISFWCTAQTNSLGCIFINPKFEHTFNRCGFYLI